MILSTNIDKRFFTYVGIAAILIYIISLFLQQYLINAIIPFLCVLFFFLKDIRIPFILMIGTLPISIQYMEKYDMPDEPLMILNTIFFILIAIKHFSKEHIKNTFLNPIVFTILITFFWLIITVILSTDTLLSLKFLMKKIWYLVPFFWMSIFLFQDRRVLIKSFQWMYIILLLVVINFLVKFSAVGFAFDLVHDPVYPWFQNHVMFGSMVSIVLPMIIASLFLSRKLSIQWIFALSGIIIFLIAVYFSYSRAAWAAVLFAGVCFVAIRFRVMQWVIISFYIVCITLVSWLSYKNNYLSYKPKFEKTIMHESLEDHIVATLQGTDISSAERYYRWIATLRMSKDYPFFGVGPNNFYHHYKAYTVTSFRTWVSRNPEQSTTHNYFLFMLAEQGIPAVIFYAILIYVVFYFGQKVYHREKDKKNKIILMAVLCSVAAIFINNFFSELLETDKVGSIFFLCLASIVVIATQQKKYIVEKS